MRDRSSSGHRLSVNMDLSCSMHYSANAWWLSTIADFMRKERCMYTGPRYKMCFVQTVGWLFEGMGQPVINGYLVAGSAVGPGGLKLIKVI